MGVFSFHLRVSMEPDHVHGRPRDGNGRFAGRQPESLERSVFLKGLQGILEQVGVNRQEGPSTGEMIHWYSLISSMNGALAILSNRFM